MNLIESLKAIHRRPEPWARYRAADLWMDAHISKKMLAYHLDADLDVASRRAGFIDRSVAWIASHFRVGPDTRIADFGCGPGLCANRLAGLGADGTGIDVSEGSEVAIVGMRE